MSKRNRSEHGFTLVEMLVALMIFGMIAGAAVALLSFSVRAQAATEAKLDDIAGMTRLTSALSADLAQAVDRPARDEGGTTLPAFVGQRGAAAGPFLRLTRNGWNNLDHAPRSGLQKVAWQWNAGAIERIAYPMVDGATPLEPALMLDKVRNVALRYRIDGAWSDRWDGAAGVPLPQAMELVIVRNDGIVFRQAFIVGAPFPRRPEPPLAPA